MGKGEALRRVVEVWRRGLTERGWEERRVVDFRTV